MPQTHFLFRALFPEPAIHPKVQLKNIHPFVYRQVVNHRNSATRLVTGPKPVNCL